MARIDVPGGWAEIRDIKELKVRQRKMVRSAAFAAMDAIAKLPDDLPTDPVEAAKVDMSGLGLSFKEAESLEQLQEATVVAFLSAWSFDEPLPTMDTVGDMDTDVFDAISNATRAVGAKIIAELNTEPTPEDEPGNSSGSCDDSAGLSKETAQLP